MNSIIELFDLKSKVAIITGASKGIGAEIAHTLSSAGASIVINYYKSEREAEKIQRTIEGKGRKAFIYRADVSEPKQVKEMTEAVIKKFNRIDILINNAAIYPHTEVIHMTDTEWKNVINVNLMGALLCSREAAKFMIDSGRGGRIVNISSIASLQPEKAFSHYCASKGGLISLSKALALEWARYNINVNTIAPGLIDTGELAKYAPDRMNAYLKFCPLKRIGNPKDIAYTALFLVSEASNFITGETIIVDGGILLGGYMELVSYGYV